MEVARTGIVSDTRSTVFEPTISWIAHTLLESTDRPCDLQPAFPACQHAAQNIHRPRRASVSRIPTKINNQQMLRQYSYSFFITIDIPIVE